MDSGWIPLPSGVHRGVHPCAGPKPLSQRSYSARVDSLDSKWLPKKSGLTLANYRAAPSRIVRSPERNRDFSGLAAAGESSRRDLDDRLAERTALHHSCVVLSCRPPAPLASTAEEIPISPGWRNPCRCLTEKCLTTRVRVDRLIWRGPPSQLSITPSDTAMMNPEVRAATRLPPYGGRQRRSTLDVDLKVPSRSCFSNDEQFDDVSAAAWTAHADAPILAIITRENEVSPRHLRRQAIAGDDPKHPARCDTRPSLAPPARDCSANAQVFGAFNEGRPSSGSESPRASMELGTAGKSSSATYSSSHAARLKLVRV